MSKKKVIKKTTKRPAKKNLKQDAKFMTPIVPESWIKQYRKDYKDALQNVREPVSDSFLNTIKNSLERQGIKSKSVNIFDEIDERVKEAQEDAKKTKIPTDVVNTILGRKEENGSFSVQSNSEIWDENSANAKFGTKYKMNETLKEKFGDDLIQKFITVFDISPSEEDLKAFTFVLKGVQNESDLKKLRTGDIKEIAARQGFIFDELNDNDPDLYETLKERTRDKISATEYVQQYKNTSEDFLNELSKNLTHSSDDVERSQKALDIFEQTLIEKTAAYYKAKRDLFVFKKAYDSALEEVFGKEK